MPKTKKKTTKAKTKSQPKPKTKSKAKPKAIKKVEKPIVKSFTVFLLRISMGWIFLYAGLDKVMTPDWTAAGFLGNAQTFGPFYERFTNPEIIDLVNIINVWGLTLIGVSLITGAFVRVSSFFGAILMILYYFPTLDFPYAGEHGFIIDDHLIYFFVFLVFIGLNAGRFLGLDHFVFSKKK